MSFAFIKSYINSTESDKDMRILLLYGIFGFNTKRKALHSTMKQLQEMFKCPKI
jgi:hypothetical protein